MPHPRRIWPRTRASARTSTLLFGAMIVAAALVLDGRYLFVLPVGADNSLMYAPFFSLHWQGGPPLWNPYALSGTPLVDNLQAALFYPPRWPFFFVEDWRDYFGLHAWLHRLIAIVGAALFLRILGLSRAAALGGALVFGIGGYMAGRIINPTIYYASCWLPWLLAGAAARGPRAGVLTILSAVMILTIGSPHLTFYGAVGYGLVFISFTLPRLTARTRSRVFLRDLAHQLLWRSLALILALGIASPGFVPGVLRASRSIRTQTTVEQNLADSVTWGELPRVVFGGTGAQTHPEYIDKTAYTGIIALSLILAAATRRRVWRDPRWRCGLVLTFVGLFFALGRHAGVQFLMPWIPGFRELAGPARALVLTVAGLALLTALGLDRLRSHSAPRLRWMALACLLVAVLGGGHVAHRTLSSASGQGTDPFFWFRYWVVAPCTPPGAVFAWVDTAICALVAGIALLLTARIPRWRAPLMLVLIALQLLHFAPRALPPVKPRDYFDPPPPVAWLQQARGSADPFRIAAYDPLRIHHTEFLNHFTRPLLAPNLATLYRLEDICGFDPLIPLDYVELFVATSGRAPFDDPIRNLNFHHPEPRLFDITGVRYVIGHPYDWRLVTLPTTLDADQDIAVFELRDTVAGAAPVTHWHFVSLIDSSRELRVGAEVARLRVEAEEGVFEFPVRNGIETAHTNAFNDDSITSRPGFNPTLNSEWASHHPLPERNYLMRQFNYRASIDFGRPLNLRRVTWQLSNPDRIFIIAAQACRFQRSDPDADPWRLVFGDENAWTPIFEYRHAQPRAFLAHLTAPPQPAWESPNPGALDIGGSVQWLDRTDSAMSLRVDAPAPALLVLREMYDPGWRATVDGRPAEVIRYRQILRAIPVPAGVSDVTLSYRPPFVFGLMGVSAACLLIGLAAVIAARRRRPASPAP